MSAVPQQQQPSLIRQSYEAYLRAGFALVPILSGKGPTSAGWNKRENCWTTPEQIDDRVGVGLAHAYSAPVTAAFDIDNIEMCRELLAERGHSLDELFSAADSVTIDSGNPGHAKLLYTIPFPLPSKRVIREINGQKLTIFELRCATNNGATTQDVLPSLAVHPKTFQHYRWGGNGHYSKLPALPACLSDWWGELLKLDEERNIRVDAASTPASLAEVRSALFSIDPNCPRPTWIELAMAVNALSPDDDGYQLWDEWSQGSTDKYPGPAETRKQWNSLKPIPTGITVATLFHHAFHAGWKRPIPDVSELFGPVQPASSPEEVVEKLSPTGGIPTVDLSLWPLILVPPATEIAREVGCDPVVPLIAGLVAVSGAVDKRSALQITPTWRVPPTFWAMTLGEPADKKTPGSKPMFSPLRHIEAEDKERYQAELLLWQGKEARHAAQMKAYREWQADPASAIPNSVPPTVEDLPPQPVPLRLLLTDATTQKVVAMSEHRARGFLLYLDEMNRWFSKLSDPRTTDDRGCWIQGYETGPYSMDRMGAGTIMVENMAVSLYGNCQPAVFRKNVESTSSDGILQRFMPIVLNPERNAMWEEAVPSFMSSAHDYEQLLRRTFALQPFDYMMAPDAVAVFRSFCEWALKFREAERIVNSSSSYQTALGKVEGNCARLLLLFHIINEPYSMFISAETVIQATTLFRTFFIPSLRYTFLEVGQQADPLARNVFNTITQWASAKPTITLADLRRSAKNTTEAENRPAWQLDQSLRVIMDDLGSMGYVSMHQDHPRFPVWAINPAVAELFADYRQKIIKAKQDILESVRECAIQRHGVPPKRQSPIIGS